MMLKDVKPELFTPEALKRKKEMFMEIYNVSFLFRSHLLHCGDDCENCKKVACIINIFLEAELKKGGKTNFVKLKKDMILDHMIFGDGIKFLN